MTTKERAEAIKWDLHAFRIELLNADELDVVERHITAAIAEDRASRECCKMEREACEGIAQSQVRAVYGTLGIAGTDEAGIVALKIAREIRARGEKK
jgi:hypothetical protein